MRIRNTSKCCLLSHSPITAFGPGLRIGAFFRFPVGSSRIPRRVENEAAGKGGATGKMEGIRQPNTPAPAGERKEQHGTGYGRRYRRADFPASWPRSRLWNAPFPRGLPEKCGAMDPAAVHRKRHGPDPSTGPSAGRSRPRGGVRAVRRRTGRGPVRTDVPSGRRVRHAAHGPAGQRLPPIRRGGPRPNAVQHFPVRTGGGTSA